LPIIADNVQAAFDGSDSSKSFQNGLTKGMVMVTIINPIVAYGIVKLKALFLNYPPMLKSELFAKIPAASGTIELMRNYKAMTEGFGDFLWDLASGAGKKVLDNSMSGNPTRVP
jgi:hypothetical protein